MAARLSENPAWTVLLLEAGQLETTLSDVPAFAFNLQQGPLDWEFRAEPQPGRACLGMVGGRCNYPRGRVLGGTSSLNYMMYTRGNRGDYDGWEGAGNTGWGYDNVLEYFIKSEDNRNKVLARDRQYHGTHGYLTVEDPPWRSPISYSFTQAGEELGYEHRDCNGARQTGFMFPQATMRDGARCSTAKAFLQPASQRPNLDISLGSHVLKIIIDKYTKTAQGVKFLKNGRVLKIFARKEVILSAGSISSPQVLMLSGVGPAHHLTRLGVPVLADLPVGRNLMDHYGSMAMVGTLDKEVAITEERIASTLLSSVFDYSVNNRGPLTTLGGVEGVAWVNTKYANRSEDRPDIELVFLASGLAAETSGTGRRTQGLKDSLYQTLYSPLEGRDIFTFLVLLTRPRSRGFIKLRDRNPFTRPVIQPGYFSHPGDMEVLVEGMKFTLDLVRTRAFRKYGGRMWGGRKMPGCEGLKLWSDRYMECIVREYTISGHHQSGTVKMGPATDPGAVVNPRLQVHGVSRLRVVDASVMPSIPSANINAPTIMVAEKVDEILYCHNQHNFKLSIA